MQPVIPQDMRETLFKNPLRTPLNYCKQVNKPLFKSYAVQAGCVESEDVEEILEGLTKRYFDGKNIEQVRDFQAQFRVFPSPEWIKFCEDAAKAKEAEKKAKEEKDREQAIEARKNEIKSVIDKLHGVNGDGSNQ